jgi:hypothetical protein
MESLSGVSSAHDRESKPLVEVLPRDNVREHLIELADILVKVLDTTLRIPDASWYLV